MGPDVEYAAEKPADPIELRVYRGADGSFTLYEDENDNYAYEKGVYATIPMRWNETAARYHRERKANSQACLRPARSASFSLRRPRSQHRPDRPTGQGSRVLR